MRKPWSKEARRRHAEGVSRYQSEKRAEKIVRQAIEEGERVGLTAHKTLELLEDALVRLGVTA